ESGRRARQGVEEVEDVKWFADGERRLVEAKARGGKFRDDVVGLAGGEPRPVTPAGIAESVISPDGKTVINEDEEGGLSIYPVEGGPARRVTEESQGSP